ncbi:MAG: hypothetical protein C5B51_16065 [Terriglobia bacterium]|nr:MAG: hypothetical protein C5B51_16065 [Terriglobia bacterium]
MKLADLRKLSIRQNLKIRFQLRNGLECIITEHGVAQVPALQRVPDFNLESELAEISRFVLEPASATQKTAPKTRAVDREELASMLSSSPASAADHDED